MTLCRRLGTLLLFVTALGLAQTSLTGYWKFSVPNGGVSFLELKQTGESVTGTTRGGRSVALAGTLHEGKLHLEGTVTRSGAKRSIVFEGTGNGDKFSVSGSPSIRIHTQSRCGYSPWRERTRCWCGRSPGILWLWGSTIAEIRPPISVFVGIACNSAPISEVRG